jgi:hypothetical protein
VTARFEGGYLDGEGIIDWDNPPPERVFVERVRVGLMPTYSTGQPAPDHRSPGCDRYELAETVGPLAIYRFVEAG